MANRTFCDYCNREITSTNEGSIGVTVDGDPKDLCAQCSSSVKETLDSLKKEED